MKKIFLLLICVMLFSCQKTSLVSLLEGQNEHKTIDAILITNNSQIDFGFGKLLYEDHKDNIHFTNIKQDSLDQEKKTERLQFKAHLNTALYTREVNLIIDIDRDHNNQILHLTEENSVTEVNEKAFQHIINTQTHDFLNTNGMTEFNLSDHTLGRVFTLDELTLDHSIEQIDILSSDIIEFCLPIKSSTQLVDVESSLLVTLSMQDNTWKINSMQLENDKTQMSLSDQVIGRWVGQFIIKDRRFIAVLVIDGLSEDKSRYEGLMIQAGCQYIDMDARTSLNDKYKYSVNTLELVPNLDQDSYDLLGGEWTFFPTQDNARYYKEPLEYTLTFNGSEYLIGTPTNWTNDLGPHVSFDQKHDSYDYD